MTALLTTLSLAGWHLYRACDLSKKAADKDTIFFKYDRPRDRQFFSVSFRKQDRLVSVSWRLALFLQDSGLEEMMVS
jgi:hypothetical protein